MELWLLVGALVLIALTVWIVWSPQRPRDAEELPVNDVNGSNIPPQGQGGMLPGRRTMGVGATAFVAVAGGIGGAWLYQRWQRKRNTRINRLRRGAMGLAERLGERMPDTDLPAATAPLGGAGAAIVL